MYGRKVRRFYGEQRASGAVVHIELSPGIVAVVPAWMLDAAICASMTLGEPRVGLSALQELKRLLVQAGEQRNCHDSGSIIQEKYREDSIDTTHDITPIASSVEDGTRQRRAAAAERRRARKSNGATGQLSVVT